MGMHYQWQILTLCIFFGSITAQVSNTRHHRYNYTAHKEKHTPPAVCRIDYSNGTVVRYGCFLDDLFDCEPYDKPRMPEWTSEKDKQTDWWNRLQGLFDEFWGTRSYRSSRDGARGSGDDDNTRRNQTRVTRVYRCVPKDCYNKTAVTCPARYYSTCEKYHRYPWKISDHHDSNSGGSHDSKGGNYYDYKSTGGNRYDSYSGGSNSKSYSHRGSNHYETKGGWPDGCTWQSHHPRLDDVGRDSKHNSKRDNGGKDHYMYRCTVPSALCGVQTACRIANGTGTTLFERPCWNSSYWQGQDDRGQVDRDDRGSGPERDGNNRHYTDCNYICGGGDNTSFLVQIDGVDRLLTFCRRDPNDDDDDYDRNSHNDYYHSRPHSYYYEKFSSRY